MACTGPLSAACMCSNLVRQELCDSLYLDDGHTLIVVDAPAEGQADAAGVFRPLAVWMFTFAPGGNATRKPGSLPRSRSRHRSPVLPPWAGLPDGPGP